MRVILIGGSSHTGKTSIAQSLTQKLGWQFISTDYIARHPGRPWKNNQKDVPPHVREHYATLSVDDLFTDVLRHYQRVWTEIAPKILHHAADLTAEPLIFEGSALWPEFVSGLDHPAVKAIWLTAQNELFQKRIYRESRYDSAAPQERHLIQKFLDRTILFNHKMLAAIHDLGLRSLEVGDYYSPDQLADMCLEKLNYQGSD